MDTPTPHATATPTPTPSPVCPKPDAAGDSFSTAAALTPNGVTVQEYLCPSDDHDWYKIPLEVGQEVVISLGDMPQSPPADYDLLLVNPTGTYLASSERFGSDKDEYLRYVAYVAGTYGVLVHGKGVADWSKTQKYSLRVTTSWVCLGPDEAGFNTFTAAPIPPSIPQAGASRPLQGAICPAGDADFYRFDVSGGQTVTIRATLRNLPADYNLVLIDPMSIYAGQSHNSGTADEMIEYVAHDRGGTYYLEVEGALATTYHSAPYELEVSLSGESDLTVQGIEVSQVVQNLQHGIAMVVGKPTVARVYVDVGPVQSSVVDVTAELTGWRVEYGLPPWKLGTLKLGPQTVPHKTIAEQRLTYTDSFNFVVPPEWQTGYQLRFEARVNPDSTAPETNFTNNSKTLPAVDYVTRMPMNVGLVPVQVYGTVVSLQTDPMVKNMIAWFRAAWPVPRVNVLYKMGGPLVGDRDYRWPPGSGCGDQWGDLLDDLHDIYDGWVNRPENAFIYGVMDPSVLPGGDNACGRMNDVGAAGILGSGGGATMAHELGHNVGRLHAPCGVPEDGKDIAYPIYLTPTGGPYPLASVGEVGVNVVSGTIFDPASAKDLMSYCGPEWFSPYNYNAVMGRMPSGSSLAASLPLAETRYLVITGRIRDGSVELPRPFWVLAHPSGADDGPGEGTYSVELQDAAGAPLFVRHFDRRDGDVDFPDAFREAMPFPANTARLVFRHESAVVRVVNVSPHAPTVRVLSPNGGESWDGAGPYTVTWEASDADGDALTARVLYSPDGGQSWQSLAVNLHATSYAVDASDLAGSDAALVRVLVSDGVNTSADVNDAPFQVASKPPVVLLLGPEDNAEFLIGEPVFLQATATDPEDGPLGDDAFGWTSDVDGALGRGADQIANSLSVGRHTITLTVSDSDGETRTSSVAILVSESPPPTPCPGDCGGDGLVTITDLIRAVNVALENAALDTCEPADVDGDQQVSITELIKAVNAALSGCVG